MTVGNNKRETRQSNNWRVSLLGKQNPSLRTFDTVHRNA